MNNYIAIRLYNIGPDTGLIVDLDIENITITIEAENELSAALKADQKFDKKTKDKKYRNFRKIPIIHEEIIRIK